MIVFSFAEPFGGHHAVPSDKLKAIKTKQMNLEDKLYKNKTIQLRRAAITAGVSLILMAIAAGYSFGYIFNSLVVTSNAEATINNIKQSAGLFESGLWGWFFILICDILVAWGLYVFFKATDKTVSLITGLIRLVYAVILGVAIVKLDSVLSVLNSNPESVMSLINGFSKTWSFGLIIFGFHLLGLGYLALKTRMSKIWGILLLIAAAGYVISNSANLLDANYANYKAVLEGIFMLPMVLGEVGLAVWLLVKGGK